MNNKLALTAVCSLGLVLSACNPSDDDSSSNDSTDDTVTYTAATIDASSYTEWAYFNLLTNSVVTESDTWHLGFQRLDVIVNDDIDLALLADQADFYNDAAFESPIQSIFVNAAADDELEHLTADYDIADDSYEIPTNSYAMEAEGEDFYDYNLSTHIVTANDDAVWVIQSSAGDAYAKFRPVTIYDDSFDNGDGTSGAYAEAEFELFIQGSADTAFSSSATTWPVAFTDDAANECYDIDTAAEVSCDSDTWDINIVLDPASPTGVNLITLNGGISGAGSAAAAGPFDVANTAELVSGIQDGSSEAYTLTEYHYSQDSQESVFTNYPWYEYGVNGGHGIWPNYRTYAVKVGTEDYVLQLVNYYNEATTSGNPSIRYQLTE